MNFNRGAHHQTQACFYSVNPLYFDNNPALGIMVILRKCYSFVSFKFMVVGDELRATFWIYAIQVYIRSQCGFAVTRGWRPLFRQEAELHCRWVNALVSLAHLWLPKLLRKLDGQWRENFPMLESFKVSVKMLWHCSPHANFSPWKLFQMQPNSHTSTSLIF